ncbi:MAG: NADPH-dependent 7-cyano-7-deazaguanine reductase QueF [Zoogloea sp.]|nr:NADPH-dependent 7-cyano-7-deazaguanine reductase QueF [Zoogloea sp.]
MDDTSIPAPAPEHSPLGKTVSYRCEYAPELLFPLPRQPKRDEIGIAPGPLPFVGEDLWNAYEISWLDPRGKPVVAIGSFRVPAGSPRLVESKSLKLYLNSFNQTRCQDVDAVAATIARDLSAAAGANVTVQLATLDTRPDRLLGYPQGVLLDTLDVDIDTYSLAPDLLMADFDAPAVSETLYSHLLKSNCLVTGQPDWGTVVVRYTGPAIQREALLRYIVSFRQHNEFHEQCVERIFIDVLRRCRPTALSVWARYTRRGGLDINPFRATPGEPAADETGDIRQ